MAKRATLLGRGSVAALSDFDGGDYLAKAADLSDLASAVTARVNLGVEIGADVQAYDADLDWLSSNLTAAGKALLDDADAPAQRTTLGLGAAALLGTPIPLASGGTAASLTASTGGIVYSGSSALAILSGTATAGQVLRSGASAAPSWSTPTFPNTATANKALVGDGTNIVLSTPTIPLTSAPTAGKIMIGDGTNWVASTPKYPTASPAAGTFPRGDGTDFVTSTLTIPNALPINQLFYASSANVLAASGTGLTYDGAGALTVGLLSTSAGIRMTGNTFARFEAAFTNVPSGGAGDGVEIGAGTILSYDRTGGAYTDLGITAANLTLQCTSTTLLPGIGTTASAANAFINNAAGNSLLRSTSSGIYKKNVDPVEELDAVRVIDGMRPITYSSRSEHDDPYRRHYGLIAEELAAVDSDLVTFVGNRADGVQYERIIPLLIKDAQRTHRLLAAHGIT